MALPQMIQSVVPISSAKRAHVPASTSKLLRSANVSFSKPPITSLTWPPRYSICLFPRKPPPKAPSVAWLRVDEGGPFGRAISTSVRCRDCSSVPTHRDVIHFPRCVADPCCQIRSESLRDRATPDEDAQHAQRVLVRESTRGHR